MGSLKAESSHALSSILLLAHMRIQSNIDLKVDDLMSLPSIEKENKGDGIRRRDH